MSLKDHKIGRVTVPTATAATIGGAIGKILVHAFPALEAIEEPVVLLLTAAFALLGGWLVPPKQEALSNGHGPDVDENLGADVRGNDLGD